MLIGPHTHSQAQANRQSPDPIPKKRQRKKGAGRKPGATGAKEIARRERAAQILTLRLKGWSLEEIAQAQTPRVTPQRIHAIIREHLERATGEPAGLIRELELRRLDELQVKVYENAARGELPALDRVLAIMERRARYLGLDSPARPEDSAAQSLARETLAAKLAQMGERLARAPVIEAIAAPLPRENGGE